MMDEQTRPDGRLPSTDPQSQRTFAPMRMAEIEITTTRVCFAMHGDTPARATAGRRNGNADGVDLGCYPPRGDFSGRICLDRDGELIRTDDGLGKAEYLSKKIPDEPHPDQGQEGVNLRAIAEAVPAAQERRLSATKADGPAGGDAPGGCLSEVTPDAFYVPSS